MSNRAHSVRPPRPRWSSIGAVMLWGGALGGFVVFLVELRSFQDTYGGLGTALLLVLWLTLFSLLFYAAPRLGSGPRRRRPTAAAPAASPAAPGAAIGERVDLVVVPSAALRNSDAQGRMMSALGPRAAGLAEHEMDMMDWGFAYGVAWAVARSQDPSACDEVVSERALQVTQAVYEAYRGSPVPASATQTDPNGA